MIIIHRYVKLYPYDFRMRIRLEKSRVYSSQNDQAYWLHTDMHR